MSKCIYSTLTLSQNFTLWKTGGNNIPVREKVVFIQGGANLPDKRLVTPIGVMTTVTDDDYEALQKIWTFTQAVKDGYISVHDREKKMEKVVANMEPKDSAAPLTPDDYDPDKAPIVGSDEVEAEAEPTSRRRRRP